ncbi:scavenger receptor cysteine-rich type 1 protein M160-like [Scomber scombrus]|uniref:scavenger receptor cysteine-rich type 1 protein M160-like n=1 Tax=Scomber scombrus TaxID=13677 RepID=UPI002DDB138E|nr:scavenger receptor cysteine-rich type 1 protein M160-like [Scomber scombrus]
MLSSQWSVVFKWSFIGFSCFVLLTTETSGASQSNDPVDARLVEGGSRCSGRLEMKHQGKWRTLNVKITWGEATVKVDYAQVACRQMDCGTVISIKHHSNNTVHRPAWEVNVLCDGTEHTLKECKDLSSRRRVQGKNLTTSSTEVVCSESVRFGNGNDICSGRVNIKSDNGWAPVCEEGFDSEARKVVCREFGCGPPMVSRDSSTAEETLASSQKLKCNGNESRLQDCASSTHTCKKARSFTCEGSYDVRLVGGENSCEGTLEGKHEGEWRPLVHGWDSWKPQYSKEVCEKLGCGSVISTSYRYLQKRQDVWELSYRCRDSRTDSSFCKSWVAGSSTTIKTVTCAENVRLVGRPDRCSGRLEVKSGPSWAPVCLGPFTKENAQVTCAELGCGFGDEYHGKSLINTAQDTSLVFKCGGNEKHLLDCPTDTLNASHEDCGPFTTEVICTERPKEPSINIITMNTGNYDTNYKPDVFKGHRFAISCSPHSLYKPFSIRLRYEVDGDKAAEWIQTAVEDAIFLFPAPEDAHQGFYECDYNYEFKPEVFSKPQTLYLTMKERHDVRLVDGHSRCAGRLEVEHQKKWRSVSYQHSWSLKEAAVVCRQLGCGTAFSTSKVDNSPELLTKWRFQSNCDGSERALMDCGVVKNWPSSSTVEVVCTDILHQPSIAIISGPSFTEDAVQRMIMGHIIIINCSVEAQYPGGHFSLKINNVNQTHSLTQPAVNHSAVFTFTVTEGNYSCVYHNFLLNHNFSSESLSLPIKVTDYTNLMLDDGGDEDSSCSGMVMVNLELGTILLSAESTVWDLKHASVVCRQLGCGDAISTNTVTLPTKEKMALFYSDCDGSESALLDCGTTVEWFSSSYVQVNCTGQQGAPGMK